MSGTATSDLAGTKQRVMRTNGLCEPNNHWSSVVQRRYKPST